MSFHAAVSLLLLRVVFCHGGYNIICDGVFYNCQNIVPECTHAITDFMFVESGSNGTIINTVENTVYWSPRLKALLEVAIDFNFKAPKTDITKDILRHVEGRALSGVVLRVGVQVLQDRPSWFMTLLRVLRHRTAALDLSLGVSLVPLGLLGDTPLDKIIKYLDFVYVTSQFSVLTSHYLYEDTNDFGIESDIRYLQGLTIPTNKVVFHFPLGYQIFVNASMKTKLLSLAPKLSADLAQAELSHQRRAWWKESANSFIYSKAGNESVFFVDDKVFLKKKLLSVLGGKVESVYVTSLQQPTGEECDVARYDLFQTVVHLMKSSTELPLKELNALQEKHVAKYFFNGLRES